MLLLPFAKFTLTEIRRSAYPGAAILHPAENDSPTEPLHPLTIIFPSTFAMAASQEVDLLCLYPGYILAIS